MMAPRNPSSSDEDEQDEPRSGAVTAVEAKAGSPKIFWNNELTIIKLSLIKLTCPFWLGALRLFLAPNWSRAALGHFLPRQFA